jgi:UDP-N-acetylmuramyl pentapeptide phosphotransferase/UDP-N-acetylglucosamine-1-phosphate transferase
VAYVFSAMLVTFGITLLIIRINLATPDAHRRFIRRRRAAWVRQPSLRGLGRAGGVGIVGGLAASLTMRFFDDGAGARDAAVTGLVLLVAGLPVFVAGLLEDFTQGLSPSARLSGAFVSAGLAGWLLDAWVLRLDVPQLDGLLAISAVSIAFTCFAVGGLTNAFNIIDGFNGLAGGVAGLVLLGIAYVAFKSSDIPVLAASLTAVGAIAGFMLLNFPRGLVYLGDGGAYLVGFWIAELLVLLVMRNHAVSAWFPVLLCSYPVFETLFSVYRRVVLRRMPPGLPDVAHLHHLIYKRLVRWLVGTSMQVHKVQRNALTSPYLWLITSVGVAPAVVYWENTRALQVGCLVFAAAYVYGYWRIATFRAPRWWVLHRPRTKSDRGDGKS